MWNSLGDAVFDSLGKQIRETKEEFRKAKEERLKELKEQQSLIEANERVNKRLDDFFEYFNQALKEDEFPKELVNKNLPKTFIPSEDLESNVALFQRMSRYKGAITVLKEKEQKLTLKLKEIVALAMTTDSGIVNMNNQYKEKYGVFPTILTRNLLESYFRSMLEFKTGAKRITENDAKKYFTDPVPLLENYRIHVNPVSFSRWTKKDLSDPKIAKKYDSTNHFNLDKKYGNEAYLDQYYNSLNILLDDWIKKYETRSILQNKHEKEPKIKEPHKNTQNYHFINLINHKFIQYIINRYDHYRDQTDLFLKNEISEDLYYDRIDISNEHKVIKDVMESIFHDINMEK